jgi:TnpA family transposase
MVKADFILYGKGGEFASNRLEDQELLMLSLHLLQVSLVYVNTLMTAGPEGARVAGPSRKG